MPKPVVIEVAIELAPPPAAVWPRLVDWERLGEWMREASGFEVTSPQREGVGVTARASVRIAGITTSDTVTVTRWEPPEWLEIRHEGWVGGTGLMHLRPRGSGSYLWWRETLLPPWGIVGSVGLRSLQPAMQWVFSRDLRLLKGILDG